MTANSNVSQASTRDVWLLAACHGLGISAAVVSVTISALAAAEIGLAGGWTTVPYGIQFLAVLLTTLPASALMQRFGRKPVFLVSALAGIASGLVGFAAVGAGSAALLCLSHALLGINLANVNFYRFAAIDVASGRHRASAMSLVLAGGTFAALLGPVISRDAGLALPGSAFAAAYLGISVLCAVIAALLLAVRFPRAAKRPEAARPEPGILVGLSGARVRIGLASGALGYGFMNLLMIGCSIQMSGHGLTFSTITYAIQMHVLAMYLPSFFMGRMIERFGTLAVVATGTALMAGAAVSALSLSHAAGYFVALFLVGLGWNAMYVGGSAIVAAAAPEHLKFRLQGLNDLVVGIFAMLGAFLPGILLAAAGWTGLNLLVLLVSVGLLAAIGMSASLTTASAGEAGR